MKNLWIVSLSRPCFELLERQFKMETMIQTNDTMPLNINLYIRADDEDEVYEVLKKNSRDLGEYHKYYSITMVKIYDDLTYKDPEIVRKTELFYNINCESWRAE